MKPAAQQPAIAFPPDLPISAARERIEAAIATTPVLIVAGATGSGKTTQLPKMCLAAGRGSTGMIAHTQPRRLAARTVAGRIAEELGVPLGDLVGYQVRFEDRSSRRSRIKLMTDGVLLNLIRHDRYLRAFDTVIIDEAHERSVNVDFLLGYLKKILPKRPDLRVIITSATVDTDAFSRFFDDAPVIEVPGRNYPIDIEYRPMEEGDELKDAVVNACVELARRGGEHTELARDILVFLPGEQAIRDAGTALARHGPEGYEVLPLYARLKSRDQQRVFSPGRAPRIVLATNIAETSLTVPRVGFVVDSGLARVKRYSTRHRIDTLGIEPIAKANAEQRAGRCGRIAPGTCVRLYAESDYEARPQQTDPELLRTNLAGVLLRLRTLGFRDIETFPFMSPPEQKYVNDAQRLLTVLGALDERNRLTRHGRLMARMPIDPRLARILLEARQRRCLGDCLVLVAAMSAGDPRESGEKGDPSRTVDGTETPRGRSDFTDLLTLWGQYVEVRRHGPAAVRKFCRRSALAEQRLREWDEVHGQLVAICEALGWKRADAAADYGRLHKTLLAGFVDYVAMHEGRGDYRGMHDARARIFPGSIVAAKPPKWIVAAEHFATGRNYLKTVARIEPRWVEEVAPHLLKRQLGEPEWDDRRGCTIARETVSIFGLVLSAARRVDFGDIDPEKAREIFIRDGLAAGAVDAGLPFIAHNACQKMLILDWESRRRSRDLFIGDRGLAAFYDQRLPKEVRDRRSLVDWCRHEDNERSLHLGWQALVTHDVSESIEREYPTHWEVAGQQLALEYRYAPGEEADGLTLRLPVVLIDSVVPEQLDWLVPGYLEEKALALLRSLPKELRRPLVPLPETVRRALPHLVARFGSGGLVPAIAEVLTSRLGVPTPEQSFHADRLPLHLQMRVELVGPDGTTIAADRDFRRLRQAYGGRESPLVGRLAAAGPFDDRLHTTWDFGDLPDRVEIERFGTMLALYPAVVPAGRGIRIELLPPGPSATRMHRAGVRRLLVVGLPQQTALLRSRVLDDRALLLASHGIGSTDALVEDILEAAAELAYAFDAECRSRERFEQILAAGRAHYVDCGERIRAIAAEVLNAARDVRASFRSLEQTTPDAVRDMAQQLGRLVYPGFLAATPPEWLPQLPRYLRALGNRCDSLRYRNDRDQRDQALALRAEERWLRYAASLPDGWPLPPAVERYRWLVEELRVSLFAQALGTATPVSGKRLERYWQEHVA